METTQRNPVDYIISGLRTAASELEELQVQIALGKAESKDLFESMKKSLEARVRELKQKIRQVKTNDDVLPIVNALEHLQVQLALGIAGSKEIFEEQRRNIEQGLSEVESHLKSGAPGRQVAKMQLEIEKFRAKLQLLSLSYKLQKTNLRYDLQQRKDDLEQQLHSLKVRLELKEVEVKNKWQHFKTEIKEAFDGIRSVFLPLD